MLAPSPRTNIKRRGSAPQLPQSILAGAAGTGGEILVPHHESPMHARRGLSLSLPSDIEASGAAGEIFVPHHDTNVSTRRRVSLTLTDVGTVSGAAGEIFVPHQDTAVSERRRVSLTLGEGILQSGNGGAAGEIFVPHHETPMQTRRRVSLSLGDVAASASGAAGEIFVPHHETPMQTRRNLGGLTLPAEVIENSDGASGEMFILNTSGSSQVNEGNMNASRSTTSSGTSGTPLSARRGGKHLSLPGVIVLESQRTGGAAGEMLQLAKTSSELARRRGSDLALPESLVREGGGAAGEMLDVNPNGPLAVGSSPDKAMSFGTPNSDRPSTAARARAKEALSEFNARPIDDRVHELTAALMREYVARHATESTELRDAFERRFPRTDGTVTKRSVICGALGVPEGSREDASILERLVRSLLENNNTENAAARFQRNVESRQSSGPSSLFHSNARFAEDEGMEQQASLGDVASKSLCFNMTDDGSGVAINGLNVTDKTSAAIFRLKSLDELDLSNAEVIGKGAGGRVLRATRVATGEQLAVKEIFLNNEDTVKQIQSEVSIMWGTTNRHKSHVPSPYLVNCEGIFFQGGTLLIAMELMDGSLKDALDAHGPFNEEQVKAMAFQMLQGLLYMHFEKKQLHRDIKPHNILYNRDGWVKLSDFGIASDKMANTVSGAQTFCGTLVYMSPNRAEGATYGFEGDLWSLGITLYQLASGKLPIGNSIFEVMQLRTNPPKLPMAPPMTTPPSVRRPYSAPFNAFMDACLDPNATSGSVSARDLLKCEWMQDMTLAKSQKIVQDVFKEVMTRTQRKQAGLNAVGLGKRDDLFATLDEALM